MWKQIKEKLIFLAVFCLFILIASGNIESIDGNGSLNMARNFVYGGDWNVAAPKYGIGGGTTDINAEGKYYSGSSKGYAMAMVPAVWISKIIYERNGFVQIANFPLESDYLLTFLASFVNPIIGFVIFLINYSILKVIIKKNNVALMLAIIISITTNLLPLAKHSFPNLLMVLEEMVLIWSIVKFYEKKSILYILAGLLAVLALPFTYNLSFVLILFIAGYYMVDKYWSNKLFVGGLIMALIAGGVLFIIKMGGIQWLMNTLKGEGGTKDMFQAAWGMLMSPGRSVAMFSPVWGVAAVLAMMTWSKSRWSRMMIFGTMVYVGFYSLFDIWSGELSWGPRYLAPLIPLAGFVLAENWDKLNKKWLIVSIVFGLYVQLVGVTVPYETQYQGMNLGNFGEANVISRQDQFDYWSLGEFMPKYSPVYRLKKNLIHRWIDIRKVFSKNPEIVFAGGATLPIENYRMVASKFKLIVNTPINFSEIKIKLTNDTKLNNSINICTDNVCQIAKGKQIEKEFVYKLDKELKLKSGQAIIFELNDKSFVRYQFESLKLGNKMVEMNNYNLVMSDSYFDKTTERSDDKEVLYQRYYDRKSVTNMTADFWWVRQMIWF